MSRTYQALKKLERAKANGHSRAAEDARPSTGTARDVDQGCGLQYERLRVWMANQGDNGSSVRVVMVTACRRGSGSTTTVAGLATALSDQPTARVLMVDGNLRAPLLDAMYGAVVGSSGEAVATAAGGAIAVRRTQRPNLFLLPAAGLSQHLAGTFDNAAIDRLVADVKARFDFAVIDTPALLDFPEGYSLARHVDAVLLVVDADRTSLEDARRTVRDLERAGALRAAIVLNRERNYMPRLFRRWFRITD